MSQDGQPCDPWAVATGAVILVAVGLNLAIGRGTTGRLARASLPKP